MSELGTETTTKLHRDAMFEPNLSGHLSYAASSAMQAWGISAVGASVWGKWPQRHGLWFGTVPSEANEIPVFSVQTPSTLTDAETI